MLTTPNNVLPLHLKQTFPPIICIFTEGEGDGSKTRLPLEIFSTLKEFRYYGGTLFVYIEQLMDEMYFFFVNSLSSMSKGKERMCLILSIKKKGAKVVR